jgi:hypothetical protein
MVPRRVAATLAMALAGCGALCAPAGAAVPFVDLGAPSGPLTQVAVGNELGCQAKHTGDTSLEFFPSTATPGDCGTFLATGGALFAPDLANHDRSAAGLGGATPFTASSQTPRTGSGTTADPFKVVTVVTAGSTGLRVTQVDTYVVGQESFRTDIAVTNGGGAAQSVVLYRAADCYLQNSDQGFGFTGPNGAVGCSANANNTPPGRIIEWVPITGGATFLEGTFTEVWSAVSARTPFANQCLRCTESRDNGAGISWSATIQPGQSAGFAHFTTFSPTGVAGPPRPPPTTTPSPDLEAAANRPACLSIPGVVRNRLARVPGAGTVTLRTRQVDNPTRPLRLSVVLAGRGQIRSVRFQVNGGTIPSGARSANVEITGLLIGSRFRNRIVAIVTLADGRRVRLTQMMVILRCHLPRVTCRRLGDGRQLLCTSRTPLAGRRIRVVVTRSAAETATGTARVTRGRYTVTVTAAAPLGAGVYAYKGVVRTNRRGERFQMLRLVTVT